VEQLEAWSERAECAGFVKPKVDEDAGAAQGDAGGERGAGVGVGGERVISGAALVGSGFGGTTKEKLATVSGLTSLLFLVVVSTLLATR